MDGISYLDGFRQIYNWNNNETTENVTGLLKVFSYFIFAIPLAFLVAYAWRSLTGRVTVKDKEYLREQDWLVDYQARRILQISTRQQSSKCITAEELAREFEPFLISFIQRGSQISQGHWGRNSLPVLTNLFSALLVYAEKGDLSAKIPVVHGVGMTGSNQPAHVGKVFKESLNSAAYYGVIQTLNELENNPPSLQQPLSNADQRTKEGLIATGKKIISFLEGLQPSLA